MTRFLLYLAFILTVFIIGFCIDYFSYDKVDNKLISVEVKGQVIFPGIYYINIGSSWSDVLDKCGGITDLGLIPDNFDYNAPVIEDAVLFIPRKYILKKNIYEEN